MPDPVYTVEFLDPAVSLVGVGDAFPQGSLGTDWPQSAWTVEFWFSTVSGLLFMHPFEIGNSHHLTTYLGSVGANLVLKTWIGTSLHEPTLAASLALATWHHLAITYSGSRLIGYVDGAQQDTRAASGTVRNHADQIVVGEFLGGGGGGGYQGAVDEFRLWKVARTQAQIQADMFRALDPLANSANLISYYRMHRVNSLASPGPTIYDEMARHDLAFTAAPASGAPFITDRAWDVTTDVLQMAFNRTLGGTLFEDLRAGQAQFIFDNFDGRYSPENTDSRYARMLTVNRGIQIKAAHSGSTYNLFKGKVDRWTPNPEPARRTVHVDASDQLKQLLASRVDMPMRVDINAGSLMTEILSAVGVSSSDRTIDAVQDTIPFAWFAEAKTAEAIHDVLRFGAYGGYVDAAGKVTFRGRYWGPGDLTGTAVASYVNDFYGLRYRLDAERVVNRAQVKGTPRRVWPGATVVARVTDAIVLPASGVVGFSLDYVDPNTNEVRTPAVSVTTVRSTDYTAAVYSEVRTWTVVGSELISTPDEDAKVVPIYGWVVLDLVDDVTATLSAWMTPFGVSAVSTVFNGSDKPALLTRFQLRGFPLQRQSEILVRADQNSSQSVYGIQEQNVVSDFIGTQPYAKTYAEYLVWERASPHPDIEFALKNQFPDVLARDLGDIVHIVESNTAIGSRFAIVSVDHEISPTRGLEHTARYGLIYWRDRDYLVLNDATLGKLDSRRLGF